MSLRVFLSSYTKCSLYRLNTTVWFLSFYYDALLCVSDSNNKVNMIKHIHQIKLLLSIYYKIRVISIIIII